MAKVNHKFTLLGNRLDFWVRNGQDAQTIGIPIGPDSSLVIAELIMHRCDEELMKKIPSVKGHRFIDDYELSFLTRTEAEDAFHILESCLSYYELALNPKKTEVLELPLPFEALWATELKRFSIRTSKSGQSSDLQSFFNLAFDLDQRYPEDAVLQFAIAKLRHVKVVPDNWELFQQLILNCVIPEPACFPYALEQIIICANAGAKPLKGALEEIVNLLAVTHASLNHTSEVANALWACLALNITLHEKAVESVSACDNSVIALLALDLERNKLAAKPFDKSTWMLHMNTDALYDTNWLLAYEANIKGWLPSASGADHVAADPNFQFLKSNKVFFYDTKLAASAPFAPVVLPTLPTAPSYMERGSP